MGQAAGAGVGGARLSDPVPRRRCSGGCGSDAAPAVRRGLQGAGQARHRGRRARLRQGQEHCFGCRFGPALLSGPGPSGRSRRLQPRDQTGLRRRPREDDGRAWRRRLRQPLRAQRRFSRRLHRQRPGFDRRQDALHLAACGAHERRGHGAEQRLLHRLRTLQGPSRAAPILAGPGGPHHRKPGDPYDLLRRRANARLGRAGFLRSVFFLA